MRSSVLQRPPYPKQRQTKRQPLIDNPILFIKDKQQTALRYERNQKYCFIASNEFISHYMFQNAHEALSLSYEIKKLALHDTGIEIGPKSSEELLSIIREIEKEYDLSPFQSITDNLIKPRKTDLKPNEILLNASENQLKVFAKSLIEAHELPIDRLQNILHCLKMSKRFLYIRKQS